MPFSKRFLIILALYNLCVNTNDVFGQLERYNIYKRPLFDSTQLADRKINVIKTNTIAYAIGDLNVTYERLSQTAQKSFVIKLDYHLFSSGNFRFTGPSIQGGPRYYFTKKKLPPAGYYLQPFLTYLNYKYLDTSTHVGSHVSEVGFGLLTGWQWAIGNRITIEVFLGGSYGSITGSNINTQQAVKAFMPVLGGSTGFRF